MVVRFSGCMAVKENKTRRFVLVKFCFKLFEDVPCAYEITLRYSTTASFGDASVTHSNYSEDGRDTPQ